MTSVIQDRALKPWWLSLGRVWDLGLNLSLVDDPVCAAGGLSPLEGLNVGNG